MDPPLKQGPKHVLKRLRAERRDESIVSEVVSKPFVAGLSLLVVDVCHIQNDVGRGARSFLLPLPLEETERMSFHVKDLGFG